MAKKSQVKYPADMYILCKTRFGELTDSNNVGAYTPHGAIIVIARELKVSPSVVAHCVAKKLEPDMTAVSGRLDNIVARCKVSSGRDEQLTLPFN